MITFGMFVLVTALLLVSVVCSAARRSRDLGGFEPAVGEAEPTGWEALRPSTGQQDVVVADVARMDRRPSERELHLTGS